MSTVEEVAAADGLTAAAALRKGLPPGNFARVARQAGLSQEALAGKLGLNVRTLSRRRTRLNADESARLLRAYRILRLAEDVLGSREAAHRWLTTPAQGLRGAAPWDCLDTEPGAHEVERILHAIDWGIYL